MAYDKDNEYYIKDSFEFADLVNNLEVPPDHVVISLDVVNLFGNIQSELAIEAISKKWNVIQEYTNIPKQLFMDILNFLMENSYFSFQGKFYLQIFGSSMGSDLSPIISLYVMDYLLDGTVAKLPFKLFLIKKYVDDLLLIAPANEITNIKTTCNSFNEHIQFTVEEEDENHSVPFLDTKVCRINNTIKLDWYRKDITSDKFIHYLSDHPIKTKINTIKGMRTRVDRICHPDFRQINSNKLFKIFVENGYPRSMLRKLLFESATSRMNEVEEVNVPSQNNEIDEIKYGSIMNIKTLSGRIKNCFKGEDLKIATYNSKTLFTLYSRLKDTTPKQFQSGIVYEISCKNCQDVYIGQTSQWLKSRLSLHRSDIKKNNTRCALTKHAHEERHEIDLDNVRILEKSSKYNKRLILEMIHIKNNNNTVNKKSDVQNLSNIYTYLMSLAK
ncbi:uncharacterized protein LOC123322309 [Coccinella septempunctata]|uniref:uncharacterized protein LOC123322309 n=1 Tax=Coccinella septempunctata TaxID=41139 RepID=UPI001D070ADB|nr:uncharacterized protein LOC123322309 [Coccinella septempunctata]